VQRQPRLLSYSEIETALTCWARWDFAYGGRLAGSTLKPKSTLPVLSEGSAWGAGVAAWHLHQGELTASWEAHQALRDALDRDAARMTAAGFPPSLDERVEKEERLGAMLDHYIATSEPLPNVQRLEAEVVVPLPSRSGKRSSTRYRFLCYVDALMDDNGQQKAVEYKLRGRLTDPELLIKQPQPRWYMWALTKSQNGHMPNAIIVDERLNEAPKPARVNRGRSKKCTTCKGEGKTESAWGGPAPCTACNGTGKIYDSPGPSHAIDQLCTAEDYAAVCHEFGELPKLEVVEALRQRQWQQRFEIPMRPSEIEQAGRDLVSAAKLIRDLDSGELTPIRNASTMHCNGCRFKKVCAEPTDELFVDSLFDRSIPKRLRTEDGIHRFAGEDSEAMRLALAAQTETDDRPLNAFGGEITQTEGAVA
jgi:hypothetical protein